MSVRQYPPERKCYISVPSRRPLPRRAERWVTSSEWNTCNLSNLRWPTANMPHAALLC